MLRPSGPKPRQRRSGAKQTSSDLLFLLMQARDEDGIRMTDEQLRDEVMTFLLAGHETTALALPGRCTCCPKSPEQKKNFTKNWIAR